MSSPLMLSVSIHNYISFHILRGVSSTTSTIPTIPEDEEMETQPQMNKIDLWLKFNDTIVEEFQFADSVLETECFGGSIKTNSSDPCKTDRYRQTHIN